ncbi:uncharacterized protein DUF2620 [Hydrogenispora ethanolica]|jgi:molybdate-binding protein|uniref:Uncharacterized protein DUF2620 n=1 Tax=Hydrogenispora ethanolica TaxID=1082276 RepID=A0A4V2QGN0_HYDET|nr:DUF2620 domain-containing protein [Hydrogenispora ethanolica]TCL76507.1 uncharacterized protein DUF2620 [Hydrogenispora ethanolica]
MVKVVIGGQIEKENIARLVRELGGDQIQVEIKSDLQAAADVKAGKADYYLGACHTGGGGALSMAMALLTRAKCAIVSMPGKPPQEAEIARAVAEGRVAFGFTGDHYEKAVTHIVREVLQAKG